MTNEILVLAEHRKGELRDISFEMLSKGAELAKGLNGEVAVLLLGHEVANFASKLTGYADKVFVVEDKKLLNFNSEFYQHVLSSIIPELKPSLILIGNTATGLDLAPSLAQQLDIPLATDCIDFSFENNCLIGVRQMYGGKVNAKITFSKSDRYILTVRPGVFQSKSPGKNGEIKALKVPLPEDIMYKKFIEYVEAAVGAVDITRSDIVVAVGRGIREKENISIVEQLAAALGGVVACSRPIIDKQWLTPDRQVGTSGKTVKPKLYIACGISGAFQHIVGMKDSATIVAINKDPNAPIFEVAHYGIVGDLLKIVPVLTEKVKALRG